MSKGTIIDSERTINELRDRYDIPLFYHPDYLDIVCGVGNYSILDTRDGDGKITAILPVFVKKKYGVEGMVMPLLTPYGGIYFIPEAIPEKRTTQYSRFKKISEELINKLPRATFFSITSHPNFPDAQPFNWAGFISKVRYTYLINKNIGIDKLWNDLDLKARNRIKNAGVLLQPRLSDNTATFFKINQTTFNRKGVTMVYDENLVNTIYQALQNHPVFKATILLSYENEEPVAGIFTLSDAFSTYNILSGRKDEANRGAVSLLLYESIKRSFEAGLDFDFEGSNLRGVEPFFRGFGGVLTPVYHFTKASNLFWRLVFTITGKL